MWRHGRREIGTGTPDYFFGGLTNGVLTPARLLVYSPRQMTAAPPVPQIARQDCWPLIPDRIEDLGIQRSIVADLILRYLWLHGTGTLGALHDSLKLSFPVLETMFHQFRQQQLLEVKGMAGNDYSFSLTAGGRALASSRNEVCQY